MGGSTYSRKKRKVEPSKREPDVVNAAKFFRDIIPENPTWVTEKIKHPYDIKQIPLDKLYSTRRKIPYSDVQREQNAHETMSDYEPITVIKRDKKYIVTSGMDRVIALISKGYKKIKARIYDMDN